MTDGTLKIKYFAKGGRSATTFVWGHYYDPHDPYFEVEGFPADGSSDFERYRAIVRSVDAEIKRLVDGLKSLKMWDQTVLIITSDHGESSANTVGGSMERPFRRDDKSALVMRI